jgi:hypothetical protein
MILELELLEQCDGYPLTYALIERAVFGGDRARLLNIIKHHHRDGYLDVLLSGQMVSPWQIDVWLRLPHDPATESDLQQLTLETTARGGRHVYDGSCRAPQRKTPGLSTGRFAAHRRHRKPLNLRNPGTGVSTVGCRFAGSAASNSRSRRRYRDRRSHNSYRSRARRRRRN